MIYLIYGTDTDKARAKARSLVNSLIAKKPDASHQKITDETFTPDTLQELMGGMGLFSSRAIVEMDMVFRNKTAKEIVLDSLKDIATSENIFIFLEGTLLKKEITAFEKVAEKIQEYTAKEHVPEKAFSLFPLTDALGKRDKKELWSLYHKAKFQGSADEEIHGLLFWQVKAMLLAQKSKDAKQAGLNPFVFQKSQRYLKNFAEGEIANLSRKLVTLYHQARRGLTPFENSLEQFILEL